MNTPYAQTLSPVRDAVLRDIGRSAIQPLIHSTFSCCG